jgi:hypothetical protein
MRCSRMVCSSAYQFVHTTVLGSNPVSIATLPPFGPIEGHKWFGQISSQWESQKNRFALISFGKIQFLPPCIWNLPFMSYGLRIHNCVEKWYTKYRLNQRAGLIKKWGKIPSKWETTRMQLFSHIWRGFSRLWLCSLPYPISIFLSFFFSTLQACNCISLYSITWSSPPPTPPNNQITLTEVTVYQDFNMFSNRCKWPVRNCSHLKFRSLENHGCLHW